MRKATIIICGLFFSISVMAQSSISSSKATSASATTATKSAALPTVDEVLDRYVKALGGRAVIEKIKSRVSKGTFEIPSLAGVKGTLEIYEKAPNKEVAFLNIPGVGMEAEGYDGNVAWELEPDSGVVHEKKGLELASAKREAEFYGDLKLKELYSSMKLKGVEKVGAREAYLIEAVPAAGSPDLYYFDTETGLLLRKDSVEEGDEGKHTVQEFYDDYRSVDGVKLPFSLHQVSADTVFNLKLTEVKQNVPVDDAKFNKPEEK
jgi:zinc protease